MVAGHVKSFAAHVNFQNHMPNGHVNQMLNVKPCLLFLLNFLLEIPIFNEIALCQQN